MKQRKRKLVVWLINKTDLRDDEWIAVWASSAIEAKELASNKADTTRFFIGNVVTAKEFRKEVGFGA
jgi:hypothetical protein